MSYPKILNVLGEPLREVVYGHDDNPLLLNEMEQKRSNWLQKKFDMEYNALGYDINITTLTTVLKKVSEMKFYKVPFAEYIPVRVGEGAFSDQLLTYRSYASGGDFAQGIINTGNGSARLAQASAGVDSLTINVYDWAKEIVWTLIDIQKAAKSGNWDYITSLEKSRAENWQLGLQQLAFLGLSGNSNVLGLFNQVGVTIDTTTLTESITKTAIGSSANLSTFVAAVLNVYRSNCNRTAWPDRFVIPESDYLGLATPSSPTYPILSILDLMQNTFKSMTGNPNFKILPSAYGDGAYNGSGSTVSTQTQYYALYNSNEESIRMNIPLDYTNTLANSLNNFSFQSVAYGEFTGVLAIRPLELYYFQIPTSAG